MSLSAVQVEASSRWVTGGVLKGLGLLEADDPIDRIGRFELIEPIGKGANGRVWLAYDPTLERRVALKMPLPTTDVDTLFAEARACASVSHSNLVDIFDVGVAEGEVWMALSLVKGATLREWLQQRHDKTARLRVVCGLAEGLAALHAAGLLHRDVNPNNVMVTRGGDAILTDLGLARRSHQADAGGAIGTHGYIAPEVLEGQSSSILSDQWAFAKTALELLDPPVLSRVGRALMRGIRADPARRWPDMAALALELQATQATPKATVAGAGVALIGMGLALGLALRSPEPARPSGAAFPTMYTLSLLSALGSASDGESVQAFESWQSLQDKGTTTLEPVMSERLAELLLANGHPIESSWVAFIAAERYEDREWWAGAARCRHLAAAAFRAAGGSSEAQLQDACAAANEAGRKC